MKQTEFAPSRKLHIQYLKRTCQYNMPVPHYHDAFEIYFQMAGKRYLFFDNICHVFEAGDVAILRPFNIHYGESREINYYERYVINFKSDIFSKVLTPDEWYLLEKRIVPCVIHLSGEQMQIMCQHFQMAERYSEKTGFLSEKLLESSVLQLVMMLMEYVDQDFIIKGETVEPSIVEVLKFIDGNYQENITLDHMAQIAHMSKYHFCRTFRSVTGTTPLNYVNTVRLTRVHNLLINTTESIDEIARNTGLSSYVNLARVFKKVYGVSPRTFRKYGGEGNGRHAP